MELLHFGLSVLIPELQERATSGISVSSVASVGTSDTLALLTVQASEHHLDHVQ
jgi:hypothetical protein